MIEIIGMTVEDAKAIERCGGERIELVSALMEGGLTPSYGLIENVVKNVSIPVNVMIRPHSNGFVYSDEDIKIMKRDIEVVKELGANGIVIGMLDNKNNIHVNQLEELLELSEGLEVTFHKAIDETDVIKSIEILSGYKSINNVLTSGGKNNIVNNVENINKMIDTSKHIRVLLGGGLNFDNIDDICKLTNDRDFHFGTAIRTDNSPFKCIDEEKLCKLVNKLNNK